MQLEPQNFDGACVHARSDLQGPEGSPMPDEVEVLSFLQAVPLQLHFAHHSSIPWVPCATVVGLEQSRRGVPRVLLERALQR